MSEKILAISFALAVINVLCIWFIRQDYLKKQINDIIIICLIIFDGLGIIAVVNLIR